MSEKLSIWWRFRWWLAELLGDSPHVPHPQWLWVASCSLCGWRSPRFDSQNIARGLALLHAAIRHPYGHTTISVVDRTTAFVNDLLRDLEEQADE